MYEQTYMQREKKEKRLRRIKRVAKVISWVLVFGVPFTLGFTVARMTAPKTPMLNSAYQVTAELEQEYNPDPCTLNVVVCEGEAEYTPQ